MPDGFQERRRFPRIKKEIPLKIRIDNYDVVTQSKDISCIGAYCSIDRYIAPLTKLSIILLLPLKSKNRSATVKVQCKGVVVRTVENAPGGYNIAIYFNEIDQKDKNKISKYVSQHIV